MPTSLHILLHFSLAAVIHLDGFDIPFNKALADLKMATIEISDCKVATQ